MGKSIISFFAIFCCFAASLCSDKKNLDEDLRIAEVIKLELGKANPLWDCTSDNFSVSYRNGGLDIFLCGENITDLTPLTNLNFDTVFLMNVNINNVNFLSNSQKLRMLIVINNNDGRVMALDILGLKDKCLEKFCVKNVELLNADIIKDMPFKTLQFQNVNGVRFCDFTNLGRLETFIATGCNVGDLSFLQKCENLKYIDISNSAVSNISAIKHILDRVNKKKEFRIISL